MRIYGRDCDFFHLYPRCPFSDKQLDQLNEAYGLFRQFQYCLHLYLGGIK